MDKQIYDLKCKMVELEDFFRDMARTFNDEAELKNICFLTLDNKTSNFITAFSTSDPNVSIYKKDLNSLNLKLGEEIIFPRRMIWDWGLWKQLRYFKIIWKIYKYGISVIMPIQSSNGVCCLIVFSDRHTDRWFEKHAEFTHTINQHISFCLESIRLYNQTLEGLIRKYNPPDQIPASQPIKSSEDEQAPALIERKVEFL